MTDRPQEPIDVQRVLMDRARRMAERDDQPHERPLLPRLVGLGLALVVVVVPLPAYVVPDEPEASGDTAPPEEPAGAETR